MQINKEECVVIVIVSWNNHFATHSPATHNITLYCIKIAPDDRRPDSRSDKGSSLTWLTDSVCLNFSYAWPINRGMSFFFTSAANDTLSTLHLLFPKYYESWGLEIQSRVVWLRWLRIEIRKKRTLFCLANSSSPPTPHPPTQVDKYLFVSLVK